MKIYTKEQFEAQQNAMKTVINDTGFMTACKYFRQICGEIGELIGDSEFKGGYDDMPIFYAHASYKTDKGVQLAIAWAGVNDLCKYEASKLGIGSPDWWYRCWEVSVGQSNSSSGVTNPEPLYYNYNITFASGEKKLVLYDAEVNAWFSRSAPAVIISWADELGWIIQYPNELDNHRLTGCYDENAKDVFPKLEYDDFLVEKIPVYNEDMTNTL